MEKIINYIKKSKLASKMLMILFCVSVIVFTISYGNGTEAKSTLNDFPIILLFYSIFAMLFLVPAVVINQACKIYFESNRSATSYKSWLGALLLNLFFGFFGAHRFYVGKKISGIIYLCTFGIFGIGYVCDLIMLILVLFNDKSGAVLVPEYFNKSNRITSDKTAQHNCDDKNRAAFETHNEMTASPSAAKSDGHQSNTAKFADVTIDGFEEKSQVIPGASTIPKLNITDSKETSQSKQDVGIRFDIETSYHLNKFINDMQSFENKVGKVCAFVPFMQYYPTYDSMNKQQKSYYFYWRNEVRRGVYPKTDLSYIFVYVYELLSGFGYKTDKDGYRLLLDVWENYRTEFPTLDRYLFPWTVDYTKLHNLDFTMPEWNDLLLPYDSATRNIIIEQYAKKLPLGHPP